MPHGPGDDYAPTTAVADPAAHAEGDEVWGQPVDGVQLQYVCVCAERARGAAAHVWRRRVPAVARRAEVPAAQLLLTLQHAAAAPPVSLHLSGGTPTGGESAAAELGDAAQLRRRVDGLEAQLRAALEAADTQKTKFSEWVSRSKTAAVAKESEWRAALAAAYASEAEAHAQLHALRDELARAVARLHGDIATVAVLVSSAVTGAPPHGLPPPGRRDRDDAPGGGGGDGGRDRARSTASS